MPEKVDIERLRRLLKDAREWYATLQLGKAKQAENVVLAYVPDLLDELERAREERDEARRTTLEVTRDCDERLKRAREVAVHAARLGERKPEGVQRSVWRALQGAIGRYGQAAEHAAKEAT